MEGAAVAACLPQQPSWLRETAMVAARMGGHCGCGCCRMASTPAAACSKKAGLKAHRPRRCLPYAAGSFKARQLRIRVTRTRTAARASRTTRSAAGARSLSCTSTPATPPTRSALVSTRMATRIRPGNASRARPTLLTRTHNKTSHALVRTHVRMPPRNRTHMAARYIVACRKLRLRAASGRQCLLQAHQL